MNIFKKIKFSWVLFFLSLLFFTAIFYLVRHFMVNFDETDNLTSSFIMAQGQKFYLDLFNMHFPLPYYIGYLFAPFWVNQDPSRAIAFFRLSLLSIYFISFFFVFLSFKNKKTQIIFPLWIILFSFLVALYHGNMYLSETFTTIFITSIFWLIVPVILKLEKFSNYHLVLLILFASFAFWTQPFLGPLLILPLFFIKKRQFLSFILYSFVLNIIPVIYLFANGQFADFFRQTIIYNFQTYSHFFPGQTDGNSMFYQSFINFFKNELYLFTHFNTPTNLFEFIAHLGFLSFLLIVILKKKIKYILAIILIFIETRSREFKVNTGQIFDFAFFPFLSISTASIFLLFAYLKKLKSKIITVFFLTIILICVILDFKPIFLQSINLGYNYDVFWSYRQRIGEDIAKLTSPTEKILIYPYESDLYFFSRRQPFDRFIYWYPWINADNNLRAERLMALKNSPPVLIYFVEKPYQDDPKAYSNFFPNLLDNYINVYKDNQATNYWIRSDLKSRLQPLNFSDHASVRE
jgi:hypothetical protein